MTVPASDLSNVKYGYDFVVATTEASINAGLRAYLAAANQPVTELCFLVDKNTGNPVKTISLSQLLEQTKSTAHPDGVDPFDIPDGTDPTDPRIAALTQALFGVGVRMQMGLPPGVSPKDMPNILDLRNAAKEVLFRMFCSQFTVIQNSPATGFGGGGAWNVWSQPSGKPWYVETIVDISVEDLEKTLDNSKYFDNHPAAKKALLAKLVNLSGSAFSLQQLTLNLDNPAIASTPSFEGVPAGSNAEAVLGKSFTDVYAAAAKAIGAPLLAVKAVAHDPDGASLRLTGFERWVSPPKDGNGVVIADPTPQQKAAKTLDYLCAVDNKPLPPASDFGWSWVTPQQVEDFSGVLAINRNTLARYFLGQLLPRVKLNCIKTTCNVHVPHDGKGAFGDVHYKWSLTGGQTPQVQQVTDSGETVVSITWSSKASDSSHYLATSADMNLNSSYSCEVAFSGATVTVTQHLSVHVHARFDRTKHSMNPVDKTITDTYALSVDQDGGLQTTLANSDSQDHSQHSDINKFIDFFTHLNKLLNDVKKSADNFGPTQLTSIPGDSLQNFVFPGGQTFAFKSVAFSDNQDLVAEITYVAPS